MGVLSDQKAICPVWSSLTIHTTYKTYWPNFLPRCIHNARVIFLSYFLGMAPIFMRLCRPKILFVITTLVTSLTMVLIGIFAFLQKFHPDLPNLELFSWIPIGAKYLFFSPLVPSKREKNVLVLLSLYISRGKCVHFSNFEW